MEKYKGGIILFHDIHDKSVEAVRLFVRRFRNSSDHRFYNINEAADIAETCN